MTAGVCPYDQLEPKTWRALLARAAVFRAIRARLGRLWDLADQPDVRNVLSRLDEAVRRYTGGDNTGGEGGDAEVVARVADDWDRQLASTLDMPDLDGAARTLLRQVRELVATACCDDPFSALFAPIQSQARELYGTAWRPARLRVAHTRSHPRRPDNARHDPYGLTAMTPWPPQATDAQIELQIWADGFGPAAYAAVPMVLTHECVCHVPARQDRARNDSQFAEGFLDWAAYHFFRIWAGKVDPQFASAARQHAERLKQVLAGQPASSEVQARLVGHHAAEELECWFETQYAMSAEESRTLVARLAVELNKADRPLVDKDHFVSVLGLPMPPEVAGPLNSWLAGAASAEDLLDIRLAM
jgi:hypothetical protein